VLCLPGEKLSYGQLADRLVRRRDQLKVKAFDAGARALPLAPPWSGKATCYDARVDLPADIEALLEQMLAAEDV
jgi:hypothetical protein